MSNVSRFNTQRGLSLIDLMVGMLVAMLAIIAMMAVYKSTAKVTAETRLGANIDGQIAAGQLTADRILQGAGYGYASGTGLYGTQLTIFSNSSAVTSLPATGNSIVWMVDASHCQSLQASGTTLVFYGNGSGYSCTSPTLPTSSVTGLSLITSSTATIPTATNAGTSSMTVATVSPACFPFGVNGAAISGGAYTFSLSTTGYAGGKTVTSTTCLFNYH